MTSYQQVFKKPYTSKLAIFGEIVWCKFQKTKGADPIEDKWCDGVWVGRATLSDEHVLLNPLGVEHTRCVKRKPESEQFSLKMLNDVAGLPWNPSAKTDPAVPAWIGPRTDWHR